MTSQKNAVDGAETPSTAIAAFGHHKPTKIYPFDRAKTSLSVILDAQRICRSGSFNPLLRDTLLRLLGELIALQDVISGGRLHV